ncbi:MAG TPA: tetratricopeptide repeat protein, partial [Candidatus Eisenbacteria bacterium]|nr:tetratricopeptide repeat protein [Candidatus Eisenbacteria bacterium]
LLANLAFARGAHAEARELMTRALAIVPELPRGHEMLGMIALAQGDPRAAIEAFEWERALDPATRDVPFRLGQAWQRLGDRERARTWYRRAIDLDPGHREARDSLEALERRR